jgi:hypothetical protein
VRFNFYLQRYNKFLKTQQNIKETLNFLIQSFTDKNLYFTEILFWDFCGISCEKLIKIRVNFCEFMLWKNNSKKK